MNVMGGECHGRGEYRLPEMEDFLEEVISGSFKEYGMVNNEMKGICSGWQHEDWHRGKE